MVRLSGLSLRDAAHPDGDIEIVCTVRPGEKLYEELLIDAESQPTAHPLIYRAHERSILPMSSGRNLMPCRRRLRRRMEAALGLWRSWCRSGDGVRAEAGAAAIRQLLPARPLHVPVPSTCAAPGPVRAPGPQGAAVSCRLSGPRPLGPTPLATPANGCRNGPWMTAPCSSGTVGAVDVSKRVNLPKVNPSAVVVDACRSDAQPVGFGHILEVVVTTAWTIWSTPPAVRCMGAIAISPLMSDSR